MTKKKNDKQQSLKLYIENKIGNKFHETKHQLE